MLPGFERVENVCVTGGKEKKMVGKIYKDLFIRFVKTRDCLIMDKW